MKSILKYILSKDQSVFSFKELQLMFPEIKKEALRVRLSYYIKRGDLYHIRRGLYAKNGDYDRFELATKIFIPSYISFETVLVNAGVIFQYYSQIFVATYQSREIFCDDQIYIFRKINNPILTNPLGVDVSGKFSIACKERAFLDLIYLNKEYYFDNLNPLNWDNVFEILPIYESKSMNQRVDKYFKYFKKEQK